MKKNPVVWHIGGEDVRMRIPLLLELKKRGFEVGAVGTENGNPFFGNQIPYYRYSLDRWIGPLADIKSLRQLTSLFRQYKPDIIHAFDTKPGIIAPMAANKAKIPVRIRTVCGMGYAFSSESLLTSLIRPIYRILQRLVSKSSNITIFQNPDDQNYFLSNDMVKKGFDALVLSSGIDLKKLDMEKPDKEKIRQLKQELEIQNQTVVIMITRLVKNKGVKEYLGAAGRIRKNNNNVIFLLVGPLASEGKQAIAQSEIDAYSSEVKYLGRRNDIPALLAISNLFVLPSYYREGVPRVLLEAGGMQLPLITADMPGCKEVVKHEWNGWLVKPRDTQSLTDTIQKTLNHSKNELHKMGEHSRLQIEKYFTLEGVADAYAEIYRAALMKYELSNYIV